jgi:hypothetical protein
MRAERAGWLGVLAVVIIADCIGERTMSDLHQSAAHHPVGRPVLIGSWSVLLAHLFGLIPREYDPIDQGFNWCRLGFRTLPWFSKIMVDQVEQPV